MQYPKSILQPMGNQDFDPAAYASSETGRNFVDQARFLLEHPQEDDPAVFAFWREKGLVKELHHWTEGDIRSKWASFVPVDAKEGEKRPLLIVLHGAHNPIYLAEFYGYTHIAAAERLCVLIPEDENLENLERLLAYAKANMPVDAARVYLVGYSFGGFRASISGLHRPELFAGLGIGGMIYGGSDGESDLNVGKIHSVLDGTTDPLPDAAIHYDPLPVTEETIRRAAKVRMPVAHFVGENEFTSVAPFCKGKDLSGGRLRMDAEGKTWGVQLWRKVNGCKTYAVEECIRGALASQNETERKLGTLLDETKVELHEGRKYYLGDCVSADGMRITRFGLIEGAPHWPTVSLPRLTWEFLKRFSRDPVTGQLRQEERA